MLATYQIEYFKNSLLLSFPTEDPVEIVGSPNTIDLLSKYVKQIQNASAGLEESIPDEIDTAATPSSTAEHIHAECSVTGNIHVPPAPVVDPEAVVVDVHLNTES